MDVFCNAAHWQDKAAERRLYQAKRSSSKQCSTGGGIDDLYPEENVSPGLVGLAVDYLTRFMSGTSAEEAFEISRMGAVNVQQLGLFERADIPCERIG